MSVERQGRNPTVKKKKKPRSVSVGRRKVVGVKKINTFGLGTTKKITKKKVVGKPNTKKTIPKGLTNPRSNNELKHKTKKLNTNNRTNYSQQIMNALDLILQMVPFLTQVNLSSKNIIENFLQTIAKNIDSANKEISLRSFQILKLLYEQNSELILGQLANLRNTSRLKLCKHLIKTDSDLDLDTLAPNGGTDPQRSPRQIRKKGTSKGGTTKKRATQNKDIKTGNEKGTNRTSLRGRKSVGLKRRTRGKSLPRKPVRINNSSLTSNGSNEDFGGIIKSLKKNKATKGTKLTGKKKGSGRGRARARGRGRGGGTGRGRGRGRGRGKGKKKEKEIIEEIEVKLAISTLEQGILDSENEAVENYCDQMETHIQEKGSEDWDPSFPRAIKIILLGLNSENEEIRTRISFTLQTLLETFENKFKSNTKMIIDTIIEESKNSPDNIIQELLTYLPQINKTLSTLQALKTLTPYLPTNDSTTLQIILGIFKDLCPFFAKSELETQITTIITHFKVLLNNNNPKIRRGVVTCIVEFWDIIGEEIESKYLKNVLNSNVLQLIKKFVQQKRKRENY
ncbi:clip-associated protein [Anaeramoeba flamelloides]|uniref:Clip-associated protein n=1 Tax=Anaeramoeba flamelloides TaxID=1746091 RepID=A0ABQ8ZFI1_9EUKA|nr:clip-associated protein [Anaeramoeba flamelloides]